MALKRIFLLILGIVGGVFPATILYISAQGVLYEPLPTVPVQEETVTNPETLRFPIVIQGTSLTAQKVSAYDGPYLEDGSDREVVDIMALHIFNTGEQEVLKAYITLCIDENNYTFYGENIPPKSTVILLEQDAQSYHTGNLIGCGGWQVTEAASAVKQEKISVVDRAMGTLVVTNISEEAVENIRIYYKAWLSPPDVYVGGITYTVTVPVLQPGQTEFLYPDHYASGFSKVVSVSTGF